MKRLLLGMFLAFVAAPAFAQVVIDTPWTRATPPGAKVAGGYMKIFNRGGTPDRLVGASSPAAVRVETHVHAKEGEVMRMREVAGFDVPAQGHFELKPGGAHLMFMDIKRTFKQGETIPVTLRFERAGEVQAVFRVVAMGASGPGAGHAQERQRGHEKEGRN